MYRRIVINNLDKKNYFLVPFALILILVGLIGPGFWKINSPAFFYKHKFYDTRSSINLKSLDFGSLKLDKKFLNSALSSKDMFGKEIAIAWSQHLIKKALDSQEIPRIFFSQLPDDLNTYQIKQRKRLFISIILPLLVRGNEIVLNERKKVKNLFKLKQFKKIQKFCNKYRIKQRNCSLEKPDLTLEKLLIKVDVLPMSMMLAQAAMESGWGVSRFAKKGNALFGQWTWSNLTEGLKPKKTPNANFAVKSFKNLQNSVNGYLLNLNSHPAYEKMRQYRKLIKIRKENFKGKNFAKYLDKYAQIGYEYVFKIVTLINVNNLEIYNKIKFEKASAS